VTAATERLGELADAYEPPEPLPLDPELVRALDLPEDLPAELSIAEVAEATGVTAHTLRYYERAGLLEVGRNAAGYRVYDREALARVAFVTRMRLSGMPIELIHRYVELVDAGDGTKPERLALMQAHRAAVLRRLAELRTSLAVIDYKITTYGGDCGP
jgi:DNA-binding transcriptional MerR regulator